MTTIYPATSWDRARSIQLLNLTPEYSAGDCYPSACLGHTRLTVSYTHLTLPTTPYV